MKILEIYEKYKIIPHLRLHMLRVAGVGKLICDNFIQTIDSNSAISACLLHDIGTNLKVDFSIWNEKIDGTDIEYWKIVKQEFIEKYGNNDEVANIKIAEELKASSKVITIMKGMGHTNMKSIFKSNDYELKITDYANWRVLPLTISTITDRVDDWLKRYNSQIPQTKEYKQKVISTLKGIEKQIFDNCRIKPEDITEEKVEKLINNLLNFDIQTK